MSMDDWDGTSEARSAVSAWLALRTAFRDDELRHIVTADGTKLTYVDARTIQARLDDCVGPQRWKAQVTPAPHGLVVRLSIRPERDGPWFDREDVADFGDPEYGMMESAFTKAFRRAAAQFGIARHCYLDNSMDKRSPAPRAQPVAAPPRRGAGRPRTSGAPFHMGGTPWNEDRVYETQGNVPHRPFSYQERWANFSHGQPGNVRYGWDEINGFTQTENGSYILKDMTWSLMADRAMPHDSLCDRLIWELENMGFDERYQRRRGLDEAGMERARRRHEYRVSQTKGVLLYIMSRTSAPGGMHDMPMDVEDTPF